MVRKGLDDIFSLDGLQGHCLRNCKSFNFDVINHEYRGNELKKSYKEHKTIENNDFKNYSESDKKKNVLSAAFRSDGNNLWVQRDLMIKQFSRKILNYFI